jgi:hypothetical protein
LCIARREFGEFAELHSAAWADFVSFYSIAVHGQWNWSKRRVSRTRKLLNTQLDASPVSFIFTATFIPRRSVTPLVQRSNIFLSDDKAFDLETLAMIK